MKSTDIGHGTQGHSDISLGSTCTHVPTPSLPNRNLLPDTCCLSVCLVAEIGSRLLHCISLKQGRSIEWHSGRLCAHTRSPLLYKSFKFSRAIKVFNQEWMISVPISCQRPREPPYGRHKPSWELISKNVPISDSLPSSLCWANALTALQITILPRIVIALNPRILWSVLWAGEHVSTGVKASKVLRFHFIWILVVSSNNRNPLLTMDLVAIVCLIQIIFKMSRIHFKLSWYLWGPALCVSMRFYEVF